MSESEQLRGADSADLIGRAFERTAILAALNESADRTAAVLLTGDAGIGKTAIWESIVAERRAAGDHVLISRATSAEARLPWVGMTDLMRTMPPTTLESLPDVQRRALEVVSLQTGSKQGSETLDERMVGTALLSALQSATNTAPVLLAIDDLPYLDTASAAAVTFALRRIEGLHPARLLATVRDHDVRLPVLQGLPSDRYSVVSIGPLTLGALFDLLQTRRGIRLARPMLLRVHETSGGNPLYALELARALDQLEINPKAGSPLPVPAGLNALVDARVRHLPAEVADVVAATAAAWRFTVDDRDTDAIEQAVAAGMVVVDEPTVIGAARVIRAAHPLLSAAAYNGLTTSRRRQLHARLAAAADDPVERVRHAALAATEPQAALAADLDVGVTAALAAGVPDIAVGLAQLSLEHTTDAALRPARLDRLADAQLRSGDSSGAWQSQSDAIAMTEPGSARARRRIRLAEIATEVTSWADAEHGLQVAIAEAADDPLVLAEALLTLAAVTNDIDVSEASAQQAVDLLVAQDNPDPMILSGALAQLAGARFRAGRGLDHELFACAIDIERAHPSRRLSDRADASYAALLKYADEIAAAESRLLALLEEARATGDLSSITYALGHLVHIYLWQGQLAQGRAYADEHFEVAIQGELQSQETQARYNLGLAMAYQGQLDEASRVLLGVLEAESTNPWVVHRVHAVLGFVALSRNDATSAVEHTDAWHQALTDMHFGEPGYSRSHLDHVCALVEGGRTADASAFCDELSEQATRSGRESAAAVVLTGRAMIEAHAGRMTAALEHSASALSWYDTSPLRFDRARTLLIAGRISRRAKAKSDARALLLEAEREFASFGATAWEAQAAAELARVNVRPSAPSELTETERLVAQLAASGLSNKEVADRTFLAVKTVEANLARVYRKLGIRSRAELGARMGPNAS
ncbi:MAG TPA: LuxR C-terminal-related transcriptional regulator [Acidothermaceae bacterium]